MQNFRMKPKNRFLDFLVFLEWKRNFVGYSVAACSLDCVIPHYIYN